MAYTRFLATAGVAAMLAACGGDSSSGTKDPELAEGSDIVAETFDDLPVCSDKREGATAYVKDEKTAYVCEDGDWTNDDDSGKDTDPAEGSSSSKAKSSSSNKNDPKSSAGSSVASSSSFVYEQNSSAYEVPDVVAVKDKSISGVSQKGPFVTGSAVKLYELDGATYAQTGKSFTGKIASDDGKFSVASVTLASQYAVLEANGYFRNEVTGKKSSGTITLNALTDLSERENVNINLLTHLEYERALYLVGTGINVPSAKKQAEAEIFNAFGIQGEFANSEDLDIFSKGEGNAALLAFSVLMLRDLTEADLTELLTKFATDIEKDGRWDDEATKAKIADWTQATDLAGILATIRGNIENWNLGTVPEFEKYVRNFWYANYGLGDCDKTREGEVLATKNGLSTTYGTKTRFIRKSGAWVEASDIEKDTYQWAAGEDGEIKRGDVTGNKCKYDEKLAEWEKVDALDSVLNNVCTAKRIGNVVEDKQGEKYYCTMSGWKSLMGWDWSVPKEARQNSEIPYGTMTDERDGKKYKTVTIGEQTWMAENLNYYDENNLSVKEKSWCFGKLDNKDSTTCDVAGRLYTWAAAMDTVKTGCGEGTTCSPHMPVQGICPMGWHLPSEREWIDLAEVYAADFKVIKSQNGWNRVGSCEFYNPTSLCVYGNGTDKFGFSALPSGCRNEYGEFKNDGFKAYFWTASPSQWNADAAFAGIFAEIDCSSTMYMASALSVRCVKD